jgi:hypothetical protein
MTTTTDLRDDLQFLTGSPEPLWLLKYLREKPVHIETIADALALS